MARQYNTVPCKVFYKLCGARHVRGFATMAQAEEYKKFLEANNEFNLFTDIRVELKLV